MLRTHWARYTDLCEVYRGVCDPWCTRVFVEMATQTRFRGRKLDISMARPMRKQVGLCVLDEWMVVEEVKMSDVNVNVSDNNGI